jgi:small subunit ribosomal protein S20
MVRYENTTGDKPGPNAIKGDLNVPAAKSRRAAERKRLRKQPIRSMAKTFVRQARLSIESGDMEAAETATMKAIVALDKAAQKGVVHKGNASRRKSRLMHQLNTAKG